MYSDDANSVLIETYDLKMEASDEEEVPDAVKCGDVFITSLGSYIFCCYFCDNRFQDIRRFSSHMEDFHSFDKLNVIFNNANEEETCDEKNDTLLHKEETKNELDIDESIPYEQPDLGEDIEEDTIESTMETGGLADTNDKDQKYVCEICSREYQSSAGLRRHINSHYTVDEGKVDMLLKDDDGDGLICRLCGKEFAHPRHRKCHETLHLKKRSLVPAKTRKKSGINEPEDLGLTEEEERLFGPEANIRYVRGDDNLFSCRICDKKFRSKSKLIYHEGAHAGKLPYKCESCPRGFRSKLGLEYHTKSHTGERPFACSLCPLNFKTHQACDFHMRNHLDDKPFKCDYCDKKFVTKTLKNIHHRYHTGEKPFICEECGMGFVTSSYLQFHKRRRHLNLRTHECEECGKKFFDRYSLRKHSTTHSRERPFKCTYENCNAAFSLKTPLKIHMKIHQNNKTYECQLCDKKFNQSAGLYGHMRTHGYHKKDSSE